MLVSEEIWTAPNTKVLRADGDETWRVWSSTRIKYGVVGGPPRKRDDQRHRPAHAGATPPGIEPVSLRWEEIRLSSLTVTPPLPLIRQHNQYLPSGEERFGLLLTSRY
ncbi:hypothetical protein PR048_009831 [Dryococelus australis]|uniref:Uncharacterized protein n=1 Tax=Dryococelus australis TaxID=614101 RepID=A0ABQ9I0Z8_9NEOP|nr:hypothetical protein PR048_009831 [Dryococelus australis]